MPEAAIVSFRLGGADGVSREAAHWAWALGELGYAVRTVAGRGADVVVPGLDIGAADPDDKRSPPRLAELTAALSGAELVVVENVLSLPLHPAASEAVAAVLRGRPVLVRHHDLPWQRARFAGSPPPADDPCWRHVTTTELSRRQLAERGLVATTIPCRVDTAVAPPSRAVARAAAGLADGDRVVLQPTRALPRKDPARGIELAEALGATYWLTGPAEEGFDDEMERLLEKASCPTRWDRGAGDVDAAYAASDLVVLPSRWEGFGLPLIESAFHRRPLAAARFAAAVEIEAAFGFRWFGLHDIDGLRGALAHPDEALLDHNRDLVERHFSRATLPAALAQVIHAAGWRAA